MSLARLKNALSRKGALKGHAKKPSTDSTGSAGSGTGLISRITNKVTSPTQTIVLPLQTVPQPKPRYPSVLERGYRVPLYPTQSPPEQQASQGRSLTTPREASHSHVPSLPPIPQSAVPPASPHPITVAERNVRKKVIVPPRALKISNGRPLVPFAERKTGTPRSPAHRQRRPGFMNQFKHPFLPLKDSDTAFPTISAPMPSADTSVTNPKLGYGNAYPASIRSSNSVPRSAPMAPGGPRQNVRGSRRIPAPLYLTQPSRPLLPATPLHLREDIRVLPPGLSPAGPRFSPAPI
ncbi:hypothetical protein FA13DRAFT_1728168 [Coprinellus micaceus]|uniref:Uncharacterized protein n=1 Tax=Coprinellus micaceus TaxID=71717 RepID=A0A4Y7TME5_COPMI|nr:hypothetical protein FA13DRAFT_1728168 [Coprinellus micaceus]